MEDVRADPTPHHGHLERFLQGLADFKNPVETISELAKHEKVDGKSSWTEAEMESELLYAVQLYLTHLLVCSFKLHSLIALLSSSGFVYSLFLLRFFFVLRGTVVAPWSIRFRVPERSSTTSWAAAFEWRIFRQPRPNWPVWREIGGRIGWRLARRRARMVWQRRKTRRRRRMAMRTTWRKQMVCVVDWLIDWWAAWFFLQLIDWSIDRLIDYLSVWVFLHLSDWLIDWLTAWFFLHLIDWSIDWLLDFSSTWLIDRLIDYFSVWVFIQSIAWLIDWGLIDCLNTWLFIHLIDWLMIWLLY